MTPPLLFLIFNRPDTTARVFEAIRMARPSRLYIAADGPRPDHPDDVERCAEARRIATAVDWDCEVKTLYRDKNLGCREAVSSAITWFFEHEEEGIILEDDCLPDQSFFPYCAELLEHYRHDERIMCITGDNFQEGMGDYAYSYYFSIYNHCWGWASWRRAWHHYDGNLSAFQPKLARRLLSRLSRTPGFVEYWLGRFSSVKLGKIDSWAYIWTWSCWLHGGLTCTPRVNLVSNIGFGEDATHTMDSGSPLANKPTFAIATPLTHPQQISVSEARDDFVSRTHFGISGQKGILFRRVFNLTAQAMKVLLGESRYNASKSLAARAFRVMK